MEARDEHLLATLRREGVIGEALSPARLCRKLRRRGEQIAADLGARLGPALRPAVATLTVSFLMTWGSLRWAEQGGLGASAAHPPAVASVPARVVDPETLERWLEGPPTLAALARSQPPPPAPPSARRPRQRSALSRPVRRWG
jgi:hypothetical protein